MINKKKGIATLAAAFFALSLANPVGANAADQIMVTLAANGTTYQQTATSTTTVAELRDSFLSDAGFGVYQHHLRLNGKDLAESATLASSGIQDGTTVAVGNYFAPLNVKVYKIQDGGSPDPSMIQGECKGPGVLSRAANIWFDWNWTNSVAGCRPEHVWVHFDGYMAFKDSGWRDLCISSDDGAAIYLNEQNQIWGWYERGDSWDCTHEWFDAGVAKAVRLEFYQNYGLRHLMLDDANGAPIPAENFNSTPNFLFDNPNVISDTGFSFDKLNSAGKNIVQNWVASNSNVAGVKITISQPHNDSVVGSRMLRSVKTELKRAGFTGSISLAMKNAYSGNLPGGVNATLTPIYGG